MKFMEEVEARQSSSRMRLHDEAVAPYVSKTAA